MTLHLFDIANFLLGLSLLYYCSDLLIDNGSLLAKKYNVSKMIIGMSLIAFGTSLPEFLVSIVASFQGKIDLVIGNVLGSNITNIGLVLGLTGLLYKISCNFKKNQLNIGFLVITSISFAGILYFNRFENLYAMILLCILCIYVYILIRFNKLSDDVDNSKNSYSEKSFIRLMIYIVLGFLGLSIGSYSLIEGSIAIAKYFNISDMVIGATAIALGTSLPELATSLNAAKKGEFELVLGNIFGSNIINIILVFSTSLLVNQNIPKTKDFNFDLGVFLLLTIVLIFSLTRGRIYPFISFLFLSIYVYYVFLIL